LTPEPSVCPTFYTVFVVAFLPDKNGTRTDEHIPFTLVEAAFHGLENATADCLEDNLCISSISDAKAWMCWTLHVVHWGKKHGEMEGMMMMLDMEWMVRTVELYEVLYGCRLDGHGTRVYMELGVLKGGTDGP
jgi:hypothetical protein